MLPAIPLTHAQQIRISTRFISNLKGLAWWAFKNMLNLFVATLQREMKVKWINMQFFINRSRDSPQRACRQIDHPSLFIACVAFYIRFEFAFKALVQLFCSFVGWQPCSATSNGNLAWHPLTQVVMRAMRENMFSLVCDYQFFVHFVCRITHLRIACQIEHESIWNSINSSESANNSNGEREITCESNVDL